MTLVRKVISATLAFGLSASTVFASAVANFVPASDSVTAGTLIETDITINSGTLTSFNQANVVIGTAATDAAISFAFDPEWGAGFDSGSFIETDHVDYSGFYAHSFQIISFSDSAFSDSEIPLGKLQIDTTGMSVGTYTVHIDKSIDDFSEFILADESGEQMDPITGSFTFEIVPEPATVLIMLLGGVSLLRRAR